jgi:hypothetical protein
MTRPPRVIVSYISLWPWPRSRRTAPPMRRIGLFMCGARRWGRLGDAASRRRWHQRGVIPGQRPCRPTRTATTRAPAGSGTTVRGRCLMTWSARRSPGRLRSRTDTPVPVPGRCGGPVAGSRPTGDRRVDGPHQRPPRPQRRRQPDGPGLPRDDPGDGGPGDRALHERIGRALAVAAHLLRERRDSRVAEAGSGLWPGVELRGFEPLTPLHAIDEPAPHAPPVVHAFPAVGAGQQAISIGATWCRLWPCEA